MDARRGAWNSPVLHEAQEGVKGGTLAGGSPFCARGTRAYSTPGGTRRFVLLDFTLVLPVPPHFFGLAQRNGVEPQRKALGVVAPP